MLDVLSPASVERVLGGPTGDAVTDLGLHVLTATARFSG
ncbi:hypothetical protein QF034_006561 [Streptomyces africanus]|uniref:Uncharacterized protein n=1 Tax=Streptomyces africanus TaxID=231024 RepID=A0ABU0QY44_9ACTN|nr:hypothetical protein [Streptomyces africanus]